MMKEQKIFKVWEWTKAMGQQHFSIVGQHETLCGKPMLGNNYAKVIPSESKKPCPDCQTKVSFWKLEQVEA